MDITGGSFISQEAPKWVMSRNMKSQHADPSRSFLFSPRQISKTETQNFKWPLGTINFSIFLLQQKTESGRKVGSLASLSVVVESGMNPRAPNQRQASSTSPYSHPASTLTEAGSSPKPGSKSQGEQESWQKSSGFQQCRQPILNYSEHKVQFFSLKSSTLTPTVT